MREVLKKAGCTESMVPAGDQDVLFSPGWYCNTADEYTAESNCILLRDTSFSVPTYLMTAMKGDTKLETFPDMYADVTFKFFDKKDFPTLAACRQHSFKIRRCRNVHV